MAGSAERLADRGDESDLAGAIGKTVAGGHLTLIMGRKNLERKFFVDQANQLLGGDNKLRVPMIAIADIHILNKTQDVPRSLKIAHQIKNRVIIDSPLNHDIDFDLLEAHPFGLPYPL